MIEMMNFRVQNGEIITPGIYFGPGKITILAQEEDYQIWRIPGHMAWTGVGQRQSYAETHYLLVKVYPPTVEGSYSSAEVKREVTPGRLWKRRRADLIREMQQMVEKDKQDAQAGQ